MPADCRLLLLLLLAVAAASGCCWCCCCVLVVLVLVLINAPSSTFHIHSKLMHLLRSVVGVTVAQPRKQTWHFVLPLSSCVGLTTMAFALRNPQHVHLVCTRRPLGV